MNSQFLSIQKKFPGLLYWFGIVEEDVSKQGYQDTKKGLAFYYGAWDEGVQAHYVRDNDNPVCFEVFKPGRDMMALYFYAYLINRSTDREVSKRTLLYGHPNLHWPPTLIAPIRRSMGRKRVHKVHRASRSPK